MNQTKTFLQIQDRAALALSYREFAASGESTQDYKEKHEYKGADHLIALELGYILSEGQFTLFTNEELTDILNK